MRATASVDGKAIVGDSRGLTLLWREGVKIRARDADQDDFVRNRLTFDRARQARAGNVHPGVSFVVDLSG